MIYKVTFAVKDSDNAGEYKEYAAAYTNYNRTVTLPACTAAAPVGKAFTGWAEKEGGELIIAGTAYKVTQNATLYAQWGNASDKTNVVLKAKNISKEYGDEAEFALEIVSGGESADAEELASIVKFTCEGADKKANVGVYDISITLTTSSDANRTFSVSNEKGMLTVTKAPLKIKVKDVTREYGAANPKLAAEYVGFKNGESEKVLKGALALSYDKSINAKTAVGTYPGTTSANGLSSTNYEVEYENGSVTVTKAGVTASAGTSKSSYLTVQLDKAVAGLTKANFEVKDSSSAVSLTKVTESSDSMRYTLKGSFSTSVTYTVTVNLTGTPSDATHEIISKALAIKPSSERPEGGGKGGGGGGGGGVTVTSYTVTFETDGGSKPGSVTVAKDKTLAAPAAPTKDGYTFDGWYTDKELKTAYDFAAKVTKNFTLYAKWREKTNAPDEAFEPDTSKWENPFTDVKENDWFYQNVKFAAKNGLFSGTTERTFEPNGTVTRAMLVTVLWRAEGKPQTDDIMPFDDVKTDNYYAEAVRWAASEGIVNGVSENRFGSDENITREQIASMIHRYAKHKGYDVSAGENTSLLAYNDTENISAYAMSSVQYAIGAGLMKGKSDTTINPKENATRAEVAAVLQRFPQANR